MTTAEPTATGRRRLFARQVVAALDAKALEMRENYQIGAATVAVVQDGSFALKTMLDEVSAQMAEVERLRILITQASDLLNSRFGHAEAPHDPVALEAIAVLAAGVSAHHVEEIIEGE